MIPAPRFVTRIDLIPAPSTHACTWCGDPDNVAGQVQCERCGSWICANCYWKRVVPVAEREAWEAADIDVPYVFLCAGCRS